MNSPSVDVGDILVLSSSATGLTLGTDLFIGREPETPDAVVTIYDTGGESPEANYTYQRPTVQIRIRGARMDFATAYSTAESIRDALNGFVKQTVNSTKYIQILCLSDILFLGEDENDRPVFTVNFSIHRTSV